MCLIFFLSTAAGCGRVSPERSSYSQENGCQRGGGNITISLSVLSLFQLSKYLIFDNLHMRSISRCGVYTVVFVCVWFQMISPLSLEQALSARDSMAKAIYGRAFTWLVQKLNQSLAFKVCSSFCWWGLSLLYFGGLICLNVILLSVLFCFLMCPLVEWFWRSFILFFYRMKSTTPVNVLLLLVCWTYMDLRSFNATGIFLIFWLLELCWRIYKIEKDNFLIVICSIQNVSH